MKIKILKSLAHISFFLSSTFLTQAAFSQDTLVVTAPQNRDLVGSDLSRLLESNFPVYDQAVLEKRLNDTAKELQARPDTVKVRTLEGIERLMGFTPSTSRTGEVDTELAYYRLDPIKGKVFALHKNYSFASTERSEFAAMQTTIQSQHQKLLTSLGLPRDEVMKLGFKQVLVQTDANDSASIKVRRGMSLAYRGFKGFPIEGSFSRVSSFTSKRVENFALSWPRFVLHPQLTSIRLASKADIKKLILEDLKSHVKMNQQFSLNMGVVFQPVFTIEGRLVHIPAMKVVLSPISQKSEDGMVSEGGYEFYARILSTQPSVKTENGTDRNTTEG